MGRPDEIRGGLVPRQPNFLVDRLAKLRARRPDGKADIAPRFVREAEWPQLAALVRARAGAEDRARGGGDERDGADVAALVAPPWRGLLVQLWAVAAPEAAWRAARAALNGTGAPLGPLDSGSSRAALLYWIASRPQ